MFRYLKLIGRFFRLSTLHSIAYGANFFWGGVTTVVYGLTRIGAIWLLFRAGGVTEIAGFSAYQFYFVLALAQLVIASNYIISGPASGTFRREVDQGKLDMNLLKPVNFPFFNTFRYIVVANGLGIVIYGLVVLILMMPLVDINWGMTELVKLLFIFIVASVLQLLVLWVAALLWLWWPKFDTLRELFNTANDFTRNPMSVYPKPLQWFLLYILPVFLMGNQAYFLFRGEYSWVLMGRDLMVVLVFGLITMLMWREGLKRYSSAN